MKINVLIVDDSIVARKALADVLSDDPAIAVAGTAPNGRIALAKLTQLNPDVVVLDVEMPEMDGLATLAALRKTHPRLPVIMFSRLTARGAEATLDALALGASDYVAKPENALNLSGALESIRDQLLPRIKLFGTRSANDKAAAAEPPAPPIARDRQRLPQRIDVVVIGVSTGGPSVLETVLTVLPADFPAPILIVQHMPPLFTRLLSERLAAKTRIGVSEAVAGEPLRPGQALVAPGGGHMALARSSDGIKIVLNQEPPENSCRPAADVLFRAAAQVHGGGVLAVVLTGIGQDGLRGCQQIAEAGGQIIVQDEATSTVWGMPGAVARAGLADAILPVDQLGPEIVCRVRRSRSFAGAGPTTAKP